MTFLCDRASFCLGLAVILGICAAHCASAATISTSKDKAGYCTWSYVTLATSPATVKLVYNTGKGCPCAVRVADGTSPRGDLAVPLTLSSMKVVEVSDDAFKNCSGLTSIAFPSNLTTVCRAFPGCTSLTNIVFAADEPLIIENAFSHADTPNLVSFATTSAKCSIEDGALYTASNTTLIRCPPGRTSLTCPVSLTKLKYASFEGVDALKTLTFLGDVPTNFVNYREGGKTSTWESLCKTMTVRYPRTYAANWRSALKSAGVDHSEAFPADPVDQGSEFLLK